MPLRLSGQEMHRKFFHQIPSRRAGADNASAANRRRFRSRDGKLAQMWGLFVARVAPGGAGLKFNCGLRGALTSPGPKRGVPVPVLGRRRSGLGHLRPQVDTPEFTQETRASRSQVRPRLHDCRPRLVYRTEGCRRTWNPGLG